MDLQEISSQNINAYISGWKELASYYRIHPRTLQKWHYKLPIPWEKNGFQKNSSVRIHILKADAYYRVTKS